MVDLNIITKSKNLPSSHKGPNALIYILLNLTVCGSYEMISFSMSCCQERIECSLLFSAFVLPYVESYVLTCRLPAIRDYKKATGSQDFIRVPVPWLPSEDAASRV